MYYRALSYLLESAENNIFYVIYIILQGREHICRRERRSSPRSLEEQKKNVTHFERKQKTTLKYIVTPF